MPNHIAEYIKNVLGIELTGWQRRLLDPGAVKVALPRQSASRVNDAWFDQQEQWLDSVFPARKVKRTVSEWHERGLLASNRDTPMFFDIQRMLDLDR